MRWEVRPRLGYCQRHISFWLTLVSFHVTRLVNGSSKEFMKPVLESFSCDTIHISWNVGCLISQHINPVERSSYTCSIFPGRLTFRLSFFSWHVTRLVWSVLQKDLKYRTINQRICWIETENLYTIKHTEIVWIMMLWIYMIKRCCQNLMKIKT